MERTDQIILIDKPLKYTSFDVVREVKKSLSCKKIGHAGTLDPLATGLLILCTEKKTKEIKYIQEMDKEYTGTFLLGYTTPSYDLETKPVWSGDPSLLTKEEIHACTKKFIGTIHQVPPIYSAIKINGSRSYAIARKGLIPKLSPRLVTIYAFTVNRITVSEVNFSIVCSKGTYIRSVAHDFGQALGVGAHLTRLRRTRIGSYSVHQAVHPKAFMLPTT